MHKYNSSVYYIKHLKESLLAFLDPYNLILLKLNLHFIMLLCGFVLVCFVFHEQRSLGKELQTNSATKTTTTTKAFSDTAVATTTE